MRRNTIIGILGALIAAMPFLGFPNTIEKWIFFIAGGSIAAIAFVISREHEKGMTESVQKDTITEKQEVITESSSEENE